MGPDHLNIIIDIRKKHEKVSILVPKFVQKHYGFSIELLIFPIMFIIDLYDKWPDIH